MWTHTELESEAKPTTGTAWRVVEGQHISSSRKLVDNLDEHDLLEKILEESKPKYLPGTESLVYLLKTPFRYKPPKKYGSRFRRPMEKSGVFYGSQEICTALAEYTFQRLSFFLAAPETPYPRNEEILSIFSVPFKDENSLNLTEPKLNRDAKLWKSDSYEQTQLLASTAREIGVGIITYQSCRDVHAGINYAILEPKAFASKIITAPQTWFLYLDKTEVSCRRSYISSNEDRIIFRKSEFRL